MTEQEKIEKMKQAHEILDRVIELLDDLFERHALKTYELTGEVLEVISKPLTKEEFENGGVQKIGEV